MSKSPRSRLLVAILIASTRSSSFPTAGSQLTCVRHSKRRYVSSAFRSACGCCLCYRSNGRQGSCPWSGICLIAKL
jgi:hypothetical protein